MKPQRQEELRQKGWTMTEIRKAESILERKAEHDIHFSKIVFWSALLVIILGNIVISLVLIPFLVFFNPWALHVIIVVLAFMIGALYNFLITDIGHLQQKHHIAASIIVPITAIVNLVIMVISLNKFLAEKGLTTNYNPWALSILFAIVFILPFLWSKLLKN